MNRKIIALLLSAALMTAGLASCKNAKDGEDALGNDSTPKSEATADPGKSQDNGNAAQNGTENGGNTTDTNDGKNDTTVKDEVKINENYADSELTYIEGTIDEIYEDGSLLVYSPFFRNYGYNIIIETTENTVFTENLELKKNQCIKFDVYSLPRVDGNPYTFVAAALTLIEEVSTQREQEADRIANRNQNLENYKNSQK